MLNKEWTSMPNTNKAQISSDDKLGNSKVCHADS
jgi:hypothetical protein